MTHAGTALSAVQPLPPQNLEAEEALLGALMLIPPGSPVLTAVLDTGLQEADFYKPSNGLIWRAATALLDRGEPADPIQLTDELQQHGRLQQAGSKKRIHELSMLVPPTANAAHHARIIVEHAQRKRLLDSSYRVAELAHDGTLPPHELLEQAHALFDQTLMPRPAGSIVRVVTLDEFTSVTEDQAEPLLGSSDETLIPADGLLLMYGDGGAGKTTLSIDALAHLASGTPWLGQPIPQPARVLLIENEGPRGPFRQTLAKKRAHWQGRPFHPNVHVLEEPWTRFTLTDAAYRRGLAHEIDRTQTDLLMVGPLASLGAKGTGTPDDVNEFSALLSDLRSRAQRRFAIWIVHHENKQGDVSGAWERVPDTLVHVSAQGNGRTRVHWLKVRWSSTLHNTSTTLAWSGQQGFEIEEKKERDYEAEALALLAEKPSQWFTARETSVLIGSNQDRARDALSALVENGKADFQIGPPGRKSHSRCYRLSTDPEAPGRFRSVDLQIPLATEPTPPTSPIREGGGSGRLEQQPGTDPDPTGRVGSPEDAGPPDDRDIPY